MRVLGDSRDYEQAADSLVDAARMFGSASYVSFTDRYPAPTVDVNRWIFLLTVAAVTVAAACLPRSLTGDEVQALTHLIASKLDQILDRGSAGLADCHAFLRRMLANANEGPSRICVEDALGMWILWNIYERAPSREEAQIARPLGTFVTATFSGWWKSP